eukprot:scaffold2390_cov41-Prasinocladus_malaysianus.AAC.3
MPYGSMLERRPVETQSQQAQPCRYGRVDAVHVPNNDVVNDTTDANDLFILRQRCNAYADDTYVNVNDNNDDDDDGNADDSVDDA